MAACTRAAAIVVVAATLAACSAGAGRTDPAPAPAYEFDERGEKIVRFVRVGLTAEGCGMYRVDSLRDDIVVPAAIFFWTGTHYTTGAEACVPEAATP